MCSPVWTFFSDNTFPTNGWLPLAGFTPALQGTRTSDPYLRASASAMGLRHIFPIQTNRTCFRRFLTQTLFSAERVRALARRRSAPDERLPPGACPLLPERGRPDIAQALWPLHPRGE